MGINIDLSKTTQYIEWLKTQLYLNCKADSAKKRIVKRGEVYKCNLGAGIGSEESKERPCVVLQRNSGNMKSPNTIVAPITHTKSTLEVVIHIEDKRDSSGNLILDGNVLLGNIICVSKARLGDYVTKLAPKEMEKIDEAISISMGIKHYYDKLNNIYNDKLNYISKLKEKIDTLQKDLSNKEKELNEFRKLKDMLKTENIEDIIEKIKPII